MYCNTLSTCFSNFYENLDSYAYLYFYFHPLIQTFGRNESQLLLISNGWHHFKTVWDAKHEPDFFPIQNLLGCMYFCIMNIFINIWCTITSSMLTSLCSELLRKTEFSLINYILDMKHNLYRKKFLISICLWAKVKAQRDGIDTHKH